MIMMIRINTRQYDYDDTQYGVLMRSLLCMQSTPLNSQTVFLHSFVAEVDQMLQVLCVCVCVNMCVAVNRHGK